MNQQEVAPEYKQRLSAHIDARIVKGIQTYGTPLMTFNGRTNNDAMEELLDYGIYQEQSLMEAEVLFRALIAEGMEVRLDVAEAVTAWLQKRQAQL